MIVPTTLDDQHRPPRKCQETSDLAPWFLYAGNCRTIIDILLTSSICDDLLAGSQADCNVSRLRSFCGNLSAQWSEPRRLDHRGAGRLGDPFKRIRNPLCTPRIQQYKNSLRSRNLTSAKISVGIMPSSLSASAMRGQREGRVYREGITRRTTRPDSTDSLRSRALATGPWERFN